VPNPGFTLAEDAALKTRLSTLTVSDDRSNQRPVQVFFRYPEAETEKLYPFITIDLIDIAFARNRQHSEMTYYYTNNSQVLAEKGYEINTIDYFPDEETTVGMSALAGDGGFLSMDQFVAMDLTYQITTHCRSQRHDRKLTADLLRYVFPFRRGFIEIPEDGTIRRCDILDWRTADLLDQEAGYKKRIFRKMYTVQINSELPQSEINAVSTVLTVDGTLTDNYSPSDVLSNSFSEEF
jgi:hypothetical protein